MNEILMQSIFLTLHKTDEAKVQGRVALELCWLLEGSDDLLSEVPQILEDFEDIRMKHTQVRVLYQLCYI